MAPASSKEFLDIQANYRVWIVSFNEYKQCAKSEGTKMSMFSYADKMK